MDGPRFDVDGEVLTPKLALCAVDLRGVEVARGAPESASEPAEALMTARFGDIATDATVCVSMQRQDATLLNRGFRWALAPRPLLDFFESSAPA